MKIKLGLYQYEVVWENLTEECAYGTININKKVIRLNYCMINDYGQYLHTLFHEINHFIIDNKNIFKFRRNDELLCNSFADGISELLLNNDFIDFVNKLWQSKPFLNNDQKAMKIGETK